MFTKAASEVEFKNSARRAGHQAITITVNFEII